VAPRLRRPAARVRRGWRRDVGVVRCAASRSSASPCTACRVSRGARTMLARRPSRRRRPPRRRSKQQHSLRVAARTVGVLQPRDRGGCGAARRRGGRRNFFGEEVRDVARNVAVGDAPLARRRVAQ